MKMRFLCMVAAVSLLAACSSDEPKKAEQKSLLAPFAPLLARFNKSKAGA